MSSSVLLKAALQESGLSAQKIFSLISRELAEVEREFERQAQSNVQVISYLGEYLRASGGKRVRPALTVLAHHASGGKVDATGVIRLATVMECLHTATLVHDDIIDNAETRRNRASVNARFGNQTAVLMGDWLYMSAFETSLSERSWPVLDVLTEVTRQMTEGELLQLTLIGRAEVTFEQYFEVLRRKTAFLFAACCEIGAILAGASEEARKSMREYGLQLGVAFQLIDDLLDCTVTDDKLGKAAGADLLEGKMTLPLIYLLAADESWRERLQTIMWEGNYGKSGRHELRQALKQTGAEEKARGVALESVKNARKALDILADSSYRDALGRLPDYILAREN
jgi:octaprenyl-diphosphate synthase